MLDGNFVLLLMAYVSKGLFVSMYSPHIYPIYIMNGSRSGCHSEGKDQ